MPRYLWGGENMIPLLAARGTTRTSSPPPCTPIPQTAAQTLAGSVNDDCIQSLSANIYNLFSSLFDVLDLVLAASRKKKEKSPWGYERRYIIELGRKPWTQRDT